MQTNRVDINQVLTQMRAVKQQMQQNQPMQPIQPNQQVQDVKQPLNIQPTEQVTAPQDQPPSFGEMFKSAVDTVNNNQKQASNLAERFEKGDPKVDLPEVMIALQKSSVSFQAMTQVRNKMLEAYKEIMNMPL